MELGSTMSVFDQIDLSNFKFYYVLIIVQELMFIEMAIIFVDNARCSPKIILMSLCGQKKFEHHDGVMRGRLSEREEAFILEDRRIT